MTGKMSPGSNAHSAVAMMPQGFGGAALRLSIFVTMAKPLRQPLSDLTRSDFVRAAWVKANPTCAD